MLNFDPSLAKEKDNDGWTALHNAAYNGHTGAIQSLLNFDRSLAKEKDDGGRTALDLAIKYGGIECKKLLEPYEPYTPQPTHCLLQ